MHFDSILILIKNFLNGKTTQSKRKNGGNQLKIFLQKQSHPSQ
jgi:hypothetical protein